MQLDIQLHINIVQIHLLDTCIIKKPFYEKHQRTGTKIAIHNNITTHLIITNSETKHILFVALSRLHWLTHFLKTLQQFIRNIRNNTKK